MVETDVQDDGPGDGDPAARRSRRTAWRVALGLIGVLVLATVAVLMLFFRHQTVAYLTLWKRGPEDTVPWRPYEPAPEVHLAVAGDTGDSGRRLDASAAAMDEVDQEQPFDALLLLGDNVYPSGDPDRLDETVMQPFGPVLDGRTDLLAILGNHDVIDGRGDEQLERLGMDGRWWSWTEGDLLLVGLDTNTPDDPAQLRFLEDTLRASDATWKVVAMHHPPYSAGYQGSEEHVRDVFVPIFERYGVQLVLSGHDHDYQRSKRMDGVTYVVSGAGSGTRRTGEESFTAVSFSWLHFLDIGVYPDRLELRSVGTELEVADDVVLRP